MNKLSIWKKAFIGACAGSCLVLIRGVQEGFWLQDFSQGQIAVGLLMATAFALISVIYTPFIDEDKPSKLFSHALVAPSFLLAVSFEAGKASEGNSPARTSMLLQSTGEPQEIPEDLMEIPKDLGESVGSAAAPMPSSWATSLSQVVLAAVTAQVPMKSDIDVSKPSHFDPTKIEERSEFCEIKFELLTQNTMNDTVFEGARAFLGRERATRRFAFSVGKTHDKMRAFKFAKTIKEHYKLQNKYVWVIQPKGVDEYYVTLGGFGTADEALMNKMKSGLVLDKFAYNTKIPTKITQAIEGLMRTGMIIDGRSILKEANAKSALR